MAIPSGISTFGGGDELGPFNNPFASGPNPLSSAIGLGAGELVPPTVLPTLPWATRNTSNNKNGKISSVFYPSIEPDPSLWDKLVPYRLVVFDTKKNVVVGGADPSQISINPLGNG